ncbi:MAG TPA: long-chain-acyl-CoA synthetase [Steroidobacteraceae bacterium]|nr:long-chain-acyl-CoA synthetase [Steroidobacteraceae bacterium]
MKAWVRALEMTAPIEREPLRTLPVLIDQLAERFAAVEALVSPDAALTYAQLAAECSRYARWAVSQGLRSGDTVGLLMPNGVHYMALWLGLTRAGVCVALLNTQLRAEVLAHCIRIVAPKLVIVGAELCEAVPGVKPYLDPGVAWWAYGGGSHQLPRVDLAAADLPTFPVSPQEIALPALDERALFIYTSGTTGLPKAANVSHYRVMQWSHWFAGMMDTGPGDRMYDCLPLYHSIGGIVATGATLVGGGTVVLRERFSASNFWRDVVDQRCTLFQYIGELCRYLVGCEPAPQELAHSLRLCCGNGLRADVWEQFQTRFRIPQILEYYASTEGNFSLYNCEGKPGAIGRIPPFLKHRMPVEIVSFDPETQTPARNAAGHCVSCEPNDAGEAIGKLQSTDSKQLARFEGYADEEATASKILRDVFVAGDAWYRSGDLMRRDAQGFFYFVDRIGDTFRWKGENVSAAEVTGVIVAAPGVHDAVVYGVQVAGADGRAGMAAIVVGPQFDLKAFRDFLTARLPDYARPVFVRIVPALELTGTFKLRKQTLLAEGYDPHNVEELYFEDRTRRAYVRLDGPAHRLIQAGVQKL